ncbi:MAG TPA: AraC family transcriptional regulator [Polyangiaceae bacterium]|nr:AraC family transcriptional regulator [Polyangiaceae bacterium]HYQ29651.1 AraC family transcriptional regulator [Polyangiaceae bacterium]
MADDRGSGCQEAVEYRRSSALPGVEVIAARHSPREWRIIPETYGLVVFRTWQGHTRTRGQIDVAEPGFAFCNTPGDLLIGTPHGAGSFDVLEIQPRVLEQWLEEQQPSSVRPNWAAIMKPLSDRLRRRFASFFDLLVSSASAMQMQSQLLQLAELMIAELIEGARQPRPLVGPSLRAAARMRECMNAEGLNVDLETLAQRAGLNRFQALRAFKQRYGLPPHAYQLCLRMNHARRLLLEGTPAADVALLCGFADQSHFNRHFKRFHAVTPVHYARGPAWSRRGERVSDSTMDPSTVLEHSDR